MARSFWVQSEVSSLHVAFSTASVAQEPLLQFVFDAGISTESTTYIACPRLAGALAPEQWLADGDRFSVVRVEVPEHNGNIQAAAYSAYRQLLTQVRASSHPYLIRIWNYLDAINHGEGDAERYRYFCLGRAEAVDAAFNNPPPAATAIGNGVPTTSVQLVALCSSEPAIALENPRQTPAWRYPRDYGPVSPGFSRGALVGDGASTRLLASGTASIVGHKSLHLDDVCAQLNESLANLDVLLAEGQRHSGQRFELSAPEALRVYLRDPADVVAVKTLLESKIPADRIVYLQGDVCRRELLIELEGVYAAL